MFVKPVLDWFWYLSRSSYLHLLSNHILSPSFPPYSSLYPSVCQCVCASGRAVLVCVHSVRVYVWTCVRQLTFVMLEAENHGACGFSARHDVLGCVSFDTVSNPASPLVHLQECCEHSGFALSVFFVWRLKTCLPVRVRLTDWLTVWLPA